MNPYINGKDVKKEKKKKGKHNSLTNGHLPVIHLWLLCTKQRRMKQDVIAGNQNENRF